jgi:hypothetical protein
MPTVPLEFLFKIRPISNPTVSRSLWKDYFQHQVVRP